MNASTTASALATAACSLFVAGCASSSSTVRSDFDPNVDFGAYRTFAIAEEAGELNILAIDGYNMGFLGGQLAPDLRAVGAATIEDVLQSKGLVAIPAVDDADLVVTYLVNVGAQPEVLAPDYRVDGWSSEAELGQEPVARGTLVVDILDPRLRDNDRSFLVWRGWASKTIDPDNTEKTRGQNLEKGLRRILGRFPK